MNARAIETEFAFPRDKDTHPLAGGLTKREYFAAMAMQGIIARNNGMATDYETHARFAVGNADALIAALASGD